MVEERPSNPCNPFTGYLKNLEDKIQKKDPKKKLNPVHEVVNFYYKLRGWEKMPKTFYQGKNSYGRLSFEAKQLYSVLKEDLEDCLWAIDKMNYLATKNGFEWTISTCLKHKKL